MAFQAKNTAKTDTRTFIKVPILSVIHRIKLLVTPKAPLASLLVTMKLVNLFFNWSIAKENVAVFLAAFA